MSVRQARDDQWAKVASTADACGKSNQPYGSGHGCPHFLKESSCSSGVTWRDEAESFQGIHHGKPKMRGNPWLVSILGSLRQSTTLGAVERHRGSQGRPRGVEGRFTVGLAADMRQPEKTDRTREATAPTARP